MKNAPTAPTVHATVRATVQMIYRAWVEAGARGYFLAPSVAVNATQLINPADRRGGYFVRRDLSDPRQEELRAQLHDVDRPRPEWDGAHPHWIVTARVERPAEVVQRGWLTWETLGEVVDRASNRAREQEEGSAR